MTQDEFGRVSKVWLMRGTWTPEQAARLLAEQHPIRPKHIAEDADETGIAWHVLDLMKSFPECRGERTPLNWIEWASGQKLHINSALLEVAQETQGPQDANSEAPMFATLQEASDWLALNGIDRTPKQIIEAGAKGLLTIRAGLPDGAYLSFARKRALTPDELASYTLFGDKHPAEVTEFGQRPAGKTELIALTPDDCTQFLQTNEAHLRGEGFADGTATPDVLDELGKVLAVHHVDALRVQGEDLSQYAAARKVQVFADECMSHRASKTAAPLMRMATPGATAPTRLDRWRVATWKAWDAALLVHGFDPETFSSATNTHRCTGLCGGAFVGANHFDNARKLLRIWEDDHPDQVRTTPADFIAWCKRKHVDTGWLRTFEASTDPEQIKSGARAGQSPSAQQGGRPRAAWRVFIQENFDACLAAQSKDGPRGLIKFMYESGAAYRIYKNESDLDAITYQTEMGDSKHVKKKTIQTAISELKKARNQHVSLRVPD